MPLKFQLFGQYGLERDASASKNYNINFWNANDPFPPFGNFPKNHPFW